MQLTKSLLINGRQVTPDGAAFEVYNPATGGLLEHCNSASADQLEQALNAAQLAFKPWSRLPHEQRQQYLLQVADLIDTHAQELARILVAEQGKPLAAALKELGGAAAFTRFFAGLTLEKETVLDSPEKRIEIHRKPLGVVASITPWNYPVMILIWHVMPALCAGNTVICKPSEYTPFTTLRLLEYLGQVLPAGVINIVTGQGETGAAISGHPLIRKIVFTGSIRTGRAIMKSSAATLKRLTLELGGNDAGLVLPGSDIDKIVDQIYFTAFKNMGQTCAALKRLYVHESQLEEVCRKLGQIAAKEVTGDGMYPDTTFGPVQNRMQFGYVNELLEDIAAGGGKFWSGGKALEQPGYFIPPTIVSHIRPDARVVTEEQFGPILPVITYRDLDWAIGQVNSGDEGLGGSVWGDDAEQAVAVAALFECGSTWINNHGELHPLAPFGGCKQSGIGCEFGSDALLDYTIPHSMHICK
ncbi:MAG: aldehyde dehydrogenase family protein [Thiolinea sp.]